MSPVNKIPLLHAFLIFIIWTSVTLYGAVLLSGGENVSLDELVSTQFAFQLFGAAVLLLVYTAIKKKFALVGLTKGSFFKGWIFIYPILIIVLGLVSIAFLGGFSKGVFVGWVFLNTFFVGISEELMFRGIILSGLVQRYSFWKSAIFMSILFGLVHVLNGFITGDFVMGAVQAVMAMFSGFLFLGIRVRSNSLVPGIILHWLWDALVFMASKYTQSVGEDSDIITLALGFVLVISPVVFGVLGIVQCLKKDRVALFMENQQLH